MKKAPAKVLLCVLAACLAFLFLASVTVAKDFKTATKCNYEWKNPGKDAKGEPTCTSGTLRSTPKGRVCVTCLCGTYNSGIDRCVRCPEGYRYDSGGDTCIKRD